MPVLTAALGTFLVWFISVALLVAGLSAMVGWQIRRLVPRDQHVLPRHLIVALAFLKGLALGAVAAVHVAGAAAALAAGDALVTGERHLVLAPWRGAAPGAASPDALWAPVRETGRSFRAAVQGEWQEVRVDGPLRYLGEEVLLGALHAPANALRIIGTAFVRRASAGRAGRHDAADHVAATWAEARPGLAALATRTIVMTGMVTLVHLVGLTLLGLGLIWLARHEVRATVRVATPPRTRPAPAQANGPPDDGRAVSFLS